MPILDVEIVVGPAEGLDPTIAARVADQAGRILATPAGETWVKVRPLPSTCYAENGVGSPAGLAPVFVSILRARLPSPDTMQEEAARLAAAIAQVCGRPSENVHILYLPEALGRIAFGGRLLRDHDA